MPAPCAARKGAKSVASTRFGEAGLSRPSKLRSPSWPPGVCIMEDSCISVDYLRPRKRSQHATCMLHANAAHRGAGARPQQQRRAPSSGPHSSLATRCLRLVPTVSPRTAQPTSTPGTDGHDRRTTTRNTTTDWPQPRADPEASCAHRGLRAPSGRPHDTPRLRSSVRTRACKRCSYNSLPDRTERCPAGLREYSGRPHRTCACSPHTRAL